MTRRAGKLLLSLWLLSLPGYAALPACGLETGAISAGGSSFGSSLSHATPARWEACVPRDGARLYQIHCAACHGPHGEGAQGPTLATATLARASTEELLLKIIKDGLPGTEMPGSRLDSAELKQLADFVLALGKLPLETVTGNAERGAQLYSGKGDCAQCHALNGRGSAFGPDLTGIGLKRGAAHLRQSLLDPAADVPKSFAQYRPGTSLPENYVQVRLLTRAGRRLSGVRVNEDTFSIQVRTLDGRVHSFFKEELKALHKDWGKSLMPSYRGAFSESELEDVVAFLVSLKGER
ncbi:MAG: c-type cytochrome [Acidobacteria bacterium]|nr:c-type cytochrome [Acidobacteriota bacterium]MBI3423489.1 c-type cytochrome [Acidobacteriota bacterium]